MKHWNKEVLKLNKNHSWKAKSGYRIFVADKGAVRFDFPDNWVVLPDEDSIKFHDVEPPDDNCRLAFSYIRLAPIDWSALPLSQLVQTVVDGDRREITHQGDMHEIKRPDLELAWMELSFIDPVEKRDARSRICLARGSYIQPLITMDFWVEDTEKFAPVWKEALRSLQLGMYIEDPMRGHILQ